MYNEYHFSTKVNQFMMQLDRNGWQNVE